jgi:hypothetical protein
MAYQRRVEAPGLKAQASPVNAVLTYLIEQLGRAEMHFLKQ